MRETEGTTPAPESATPTDDQLMVDPNGYEEDDDYTRRQVLGLRPIFAGGKDPHPDTIPCPPWCWRAGEPTGSHAPSPQRPTWSWHTSHPVSLAWEAVAGEQIEDGVALSTIDVGLQGWRDQEPRIQVTPDRFGDMSFVGTSRTRPSVILTLDDAQELAGMLLPLVEQARGTRLAEEPVTE